MRKKPIALHILKKNYKLQEELPQKRNFLCRVLPARFQRRADLCYLSPRMYLLPIVVRQKSILLVSYHLLF